MNELTLAVQSRDELGKNANRRLRAAGKVPAVLYGGDLDPVSIQVEARSIQDLLRGAGENSVILLELDGTKQKRHTMIRELQVDPRTGAFIHLDFNRIDMRQKVRVRVPLQVVGTAEGVKNEGGFLDFVTRELEVECLPAKIPPYFELDVAELHIGQHLEAADVELPEAVELVDEPQRVLVSIAQARAAEAEEEEELAEEAAEEPEVIGKGKEEGAEEGS